MTVNSQCDYSHARVRLLFGKIAGKTEVWYPHVSVLIQEDIGGLKWKRRWFLRVPKASRGLENFQSHRHLLSLFYPSSFLHMNSSINYIITSKCGMRLTMTPMLSITLAGEWRGGMEKSLLVWQWNTGQVTQEGHHHSSSLLQYFPSTQEPQSSRDGVSLHKGSESTGSSASVNH